jgi:hypothetical protein
MTDLTPVTALLTAYHPQFAHANYAPVRQWIEDGADMERDILPVLRDWTAKKADIYSLGFFTPYVRQARLSRQEVKQPLTDENRAKRIAFITRRVGKCLPRESAWLDRYEATHGKVVLDDKFVASKPW